MRIGIKSRLEHLENRVGTRGGLTVIITDLNGGPLTGAEVHGETIERPMHEAEQDFIDRVKKQHRQQMKMDEHVLVIMEIRGQL